MPISTITSKGQTTAPKEVRDALDLDAGYKLNWEITGGRVAITTERPALYRYKDIIKHGPADAVQAVIEARKTRGSMPLTSERPLRRDLANLDINARSRDW